MKIVIVALLLLVIYLISQIYKVRELGRTNLSRLQRKNDELNDRIIRACENFHKKEEESHSKINFIMTQLESEGIYYVQEVDNDPYILFSLDGRMKDSKGSFLFKETAYWATGCWACGMHGANCSSEEEALSQGCIGCGTPLASTEQISRTRVYL